MKLEGKKIGLAITGSFCTFSKMEEAVTALMAEGASIYPIISTNVQTTDSRFGDTTEFISHISDLTGNPHSEAGGCRTDWSAGLPGYSSHCTVYGEHPGKAG